MRGGTKLLIILAIIAVFLLAFVGGYNRMVGLDESVKTAWSQVDVQLQRRYDLIPNLVETVKGYAGHEKEVFIRVTEARAKVAGAQTVEAKIRANNELTSALGRLLVVVERYPDLKANTNFIRLQDELAGTENRIAVARRRYNEAVKEYNQYIRRFPTNFIAGLFNFERAPLYQIPEAAKEVPKVKF
ncbi:MAG: LemA family protein [Candidatus Latescibacterota bacterium]|nr:MAG: LemA family protein [Candidatus Latescibacterota bacterium]RKY72725.1 MAG: LemA family protein [Candidatus Latescibacterota bacterium]